MAIKSLNPYIKFNGTALQAIALYERVLGATAINVARAGDLPGTDASPDSRDRVVHAALRVGASQLMLSDGTTAESPFNGNVHVSLDVAMVAGNPGLIGNGAQRASAEYMRPETATVLWVWQLP